MVSYLAYAQCIGRANLFMHDLYIMHMLYLWLLFAYIISVINGWACIPVKIII